MRKALNTLVVAGTVFISVGSVLAADPNIKTSTQSFTVKLGATRVVYDPESGGSSLEISNPQEYPILVQSKVLGEDKKSTTDFMVTPPVFRLDGQQQSRIRIVRTGGEFAHDRETLRWLCVTGVPPKADDEWAQGDKKTSKEVSLNIQMSISSCVKLLVRPSSITGGPETVASTLTWNKEGDKLKVTNPTPYYMSLSNVRLGGVTVNPDYVPPRGSQTLAIPKSASGNKVEWKVITDYGGESQVYQSIVK
ncbi:fimbria/pilus periplasmic chaperone [Serratia sp. 2723]|uniref:fimbria/pilus periplasmic chaperone n=1 Tax=unclassified Serratia (in: enterobacteria) TaxID=2647522 RepID=UPI003D249820